MVLKSSLSIIDSWNTYIHTYIHTEEFFKVAKVKTARTTKKKNAVMDMI